MRDKVRFVPPKLAALLENKGFDWYSDYFYFGKNLIGHRLATGRTIDLPENKTVAHPKI